MEEPKKHWAIMRNGVLLNRPLCNTDGYSETVDHMSKVTCLTCLRMLNRSKK